MATISSRVQLIASAPFFWMDVIVFSCLFMTVVSGFLTIGTAPSPLRGKLKYIANVCFALAFVFGSADRLITIHFAPKMLFKGAIRSLTDHGGKNPTCDIRLASTDGTTATLHGEFSCAGLHAGDETRIVYLVFNDSIARLDVLAGSDAGSVRNGGDLFATFMSLCFGCFLFWAALKSLKTNPTGKPKEQRRDTALVSDVDTKSLLNLKETD